MKTTADESLHHGVPAAPQSHLHPALLLMPQAPPSSPNLRAQQVNCPSATPAPALLNNHPPAAGCISCTAASISRAVGSSENPERQLAMAAFCIGQAQRDQAVAVESRASHDATAAWLPVSGLRHTPPRPQPVLSSTMLSLRRKCIPLSLFILPCATHPGDGCCPALEAHPPHLGSGCKPALGHASAMGLCLGSLNCCCIPHRHRIAVVLQKRRVQSCEKKRQTNHVKGVRAQAYERRQPAAQALLRRWRRRQCRPCLLGPIVGSAAPPGAQGPAPCYSEHLMGVQGRTEGAGMRSCG